MADYTRYRTRPDDTPRRGRARRQKTTAKKKRKLLWLKITAVVVLLLVIVVLGVAAGAIFALSRNLPSLEELRKRPNGREHHDLRSQRPAHRRAARRREPRA